MAATGSAGLTFTSQGTGADILALSDGLQFQNGKYLRAPISKTLRRVQIGIEYTLLGDGSATAFVVEVARATAATRTRVSVSSMATYGLLHTTETAAGILTSTPIRRWALSWRGTL